MSEKLIQEIKVMSGAETFFYKKGNTGCLLCHGFTGTPDEMKSIGEFLASKDISVIGPRLPGHGTTLEDLKTKTAVDWLAEYRKSFTKLKDICNEVFICGLSMGGVLTLDFAIENDVSGIITLATPIKFRGLDMHFLNTFSPFVKRLSIKKTKKELEDQKTNRILAYKRYPLGPAACLAKLIKKTRASIDKIKDPILILQGSLDDKWIVDSSKIIQDKISSKDKKLIYLKNSPHNIPKGPEIDIVKQKIYEFITKHSKNIS